MSIIGRVLDLVFPKFCVGCGAWGVYLCRSCYAKLQFTDFPLCPGCMKKIATLSVHSKCREKTNLDGLIAMTSFDGPIKMLITDIKYSYYFDEMHTLAVLFGHYLRQSSPTSLKSGVLVPVPIHREKQWERGFNQSELLAKELSQMLHLPYDPKCLVKRRKTPSQAGLDRQERLKNVANAFETRSPLLPSSTIFLVDDVVTTGSTLSACAKSLKKAGAGKVYGLAIAHGH